MKTSEIDFETLAAKLELFAEFSRSVPNAVTGGERRRMLWNISNELEKISHKLRECIEDDRS